MKLNLNFKKGKLVKAPYPIVLFNNFILAKECKKICKEIEKFSEFDDLVMSGRYRVNKGSNRFSDYLKKSPYLESLYNQLNNQKIYLKISKILNKNNSNLKWTPEIERPIYSKDSFGRQKFNLFDYFRETSFFSKFFNQRINLDMDFSKSKKGYFRNAHRDRDTRIISFLIYLNTIKAKDGGQFEVFKLKKNKSYEYEDLKRFPDLKEVKKIKSFPPKSGQLFIFLSSPDSYHGVSKFCSDKKDRIFVYGSYSMDRKVTWSFND